MSLSSTNMRTVKFLCISLCLHVAVFFLFWQNAGFQYGIARGERAAGASSKTILATLISRGTADIRTSPAPVSTSVPPSAPPSPAKTAQAGEPPARPDATDTAPEYFTTGSLTRLPAPAADIDLNLEAISALAINEKLELTVFVDATGKVADVQYAADIRGNARIFAERVTDRFKNARFLPGEINGTPVNSQLHITVVSETLPAGEQH